MYTVILSGSSLATNLDTSHKHLHVLVNQLLMFNVRGLHQITHYLMVLPHAAKILMKSLVLRHIYEKPSWR